MATLTKRASGITQTGWTNATNAYDAGSGTFATWASTTANETNTIYLTGYDIAGAGLGSGDRLDSVQFVVKQYVSATNRMVAPTVRPYVGATAKGSGSTTLSNSNQSSNSQTVTITGLTVADLRDSTFQVQFVATHYNGTISGTQYLDYIDVTVNYTQPTAPTSRTLTATVISSTRVDLSWNAEVVYPDPTYSVERSTDNVNFTTIQTGLTGTTTQINNLITGTLYYFRIVGTNSAGSATSNTVSATPTPWFYENTLEGGTDETSIPASPGLSGPNAFDLFYSNTAAVYDTAVAKSGTVSMRTEHTTGVSGSSMAGWTFTSIGRSPWYARAYLYVGAYPAATTTIIRVGSTTDTALVNIQINSDGTLRVGSTSGTAIVPLNQWVRLEVSYQSSINETVRYYSSPESQTATDTISEVAGPGTVGTVRFGVNATTNAGPLWWDSIKMGESAIGPEPLPTDPFPFIGGGYYGG